MDMCLSLFFFLYFLSLFSHLHRIKAIHIHHIHPPLYAYVNVIYPFSTTRKNDNKQHNLPWAPDPAMLGVFILEKLCKFEGGPTILSFWTASDAQDA
jgi:hypothetical protein